MACNFMTSGLSASYIAPCWMHSRWAKRPSVGLSKCWSRRHGHSIASLNCPFTTANAVMAALKWLAHSSGVSRQPIICYAQQCAMQERGGDMSDTALVVMARYPEVGKTKTRLAH